MFHIFPLLLMINVVSNVYLHLSVWKQEHASLIKSFLISGLLTKLFAVCNSKHISGKISFPTWQPSATLMYWLLTTAKFFVWFYCASFATVLATTFSQSQQVCCGVTIGNGKFYLRSTLRFSLLHMVFIMGNKLREKVTIGHWNVSSLLIAFPTTNSNK